MSPSEIVVAAFAAIFGEFDPQAAQDLLSPDYIQHNHALPTGAAPIIGVIPALHESGITVTTHRVIAEGDLVVMHNTYDNAQMFGAKKLVAFDVFRVADGKVAEHWDNLQPWADETASGRTMVDGPTEVADLDKTAENRALIEGFMVDILHGKAPEKVTDYISATQYDQHNPQVADGLDGLMAALEYMASQNMAMTYTDTPIIVVEGNFAFAASEGAFGDTPTAFFDLFRIEDGLIVEHWDVVSAIPPQSEWQNENGKF